MKILVTTDFSSNSEGAIRFVQTLAQQTENIDVTFYHAIHIIKPTRWSDAFFIGYKDEEVKRLSADLQKFVYASIGQEEVKFAKVKFVVDNCISTEKDII